MSNNKPKANDHMLKTGFVSFSISIIANLKASHCVTHCDTLQTCNLCQMFTSEQGRWGSCG